MADIMAVAYVVRPDGFDDAVNSDRYAWTLRIEQRSEGRWAIVKSARVLDVDGNWVDESIPSERTDEFKARTRFDLDTAKRLALARVNDVRQWGRTLAEASAEVAARLGTE